MRIHLKIKLFLLLFIGGCATTWPVPGTLSDCAESVEVPSKFWGDHVFIGASFDSSKANYRLLDTGFTFSTIDYKTAESLNMLTAGEARLHGIGQVKRVGEVSSSPVKVQVAKTDPYEKSLPIVDLSEVDPFLGRNLNGVIGADLFFRFVVEIDYTTKKVKLFDKRTFKPDPESIAIPITIRQNLPYVEAALSVSEEEKIKGLFMIDTGSILSLSINSPFSDQFNLLESIPDLKTSHSTGVGGSINTCAGILNRFTMNKISLDQVPITLSSSESGLTSNKDYAGSIGAKILKRFKVTFDYENGTMYLKPKEDFDRPFSNSYSGLSMRSSGPDFDNFSVYRAYEESPASRADIREGDILISVEGKPADLFTMPEIREIFNRTPGTVLKLELKRGEKILFRELTIEPLQ